MATHTSIAKAINVKPFNLLKAQFPNRCPKARLGRAGVLFIVLLGLELGLQLLGGGPVLPLFATALCQES